MQLRLSQPSPGTESAQQLSEQAATPAPEETSEFEQFIAGTSSSEVSTQIKQFGYDLFRVPPSTFAPAANVPVGPGYVVGPGDEIRIAVWGKVEGRWTVVVDRDGAISLPKVGVVGVTGLTFSELKSFLQKEFSKYYTGFEMNVSLGSLRSIKIYLVGNARQPGAYTVSSLSTLVNALIQAGGPNKSGTMRDIQVKRGGETVVHFDMYDFLLKGDKTKDIRLMPEDVIFIPPVRSRAGIAGNVNRPAIYEFMGETRLRDLLSMAGGLASTAFQGRIQVQRIEDHQFRTLFDSDLIDLEGNAEKNFVLRDGDLVKVFAVVETKNTVTLSGAVVSQGDYAIIPGTTKVAEVLAEAGGILYYASHKAELTRVTVTQSGPETELINIDISRALEGDPDHNIPLAINDYLIVRTVPEWDLYKTVSVTGQVRFPGTYTIQRGEQLSSLIERAGGYTEKAYLRGAVFTRESIRALQQTQIDKMVARLELELYSTGAMETSAAVTQEEARIKELELKQQRELIEKLKDVKAQGRMVIVLNHLEALKKSIYDIELQENDSLYIPDNPRSIQVIGSVYNQTAYVYDKGKQVSSYIKLAGGYRDSADKKKTYLLKVDGTAVTPQKGFTSFSWDSDANRWEIGLRAL
jgi:protein involved in polysaccharide export with SLBB domain